MSVDPPSDLQEVAFAGIAEGLAIETRLFLPVLCGPEDLPEDVPRIADPQGLQVIQRDHPDQFACQVRIILQVVFQAQTHENFAELIGLHEVDLDLRLDAPKEGLVHQPCRIEAEDLAVLLPIGEPLGERGSRPGPVKAEQVQRSRKTGGSQAHCRRSTQKFAIFGNLLFWGQGRTEEALEDIRAAAHSGYLQARNFLRARNLGGLD